MMEKGVDLNSLYMKIPITGNGDLSMIKKNLKPKTNMIIQSIQNRIYELRGERVMLDFDLAALYEVETRVLNQAVKRNLKRFPSDFMYQLTKQEYASIREGIDALEPGMSSQIVTTYPNKRPNTALPYAFTEQGVC